jgi:LmbE family N-acetylglucosaminyl deacetylase
VSARDHLYMPGLDQIGIPFWRPEVLYLWSAGEPDYTEDVSDTLEVKLAALQEHRTQLAVSQRFVERMRQRSIEQGQAAGYAAGEQFRKMVV